MLTGAIILEHIITWRTRDHHTLVPPNFALVPLGPTCCPAGAGAVLLHKLRSVSEFIIRVLVHQLSLLLKLQNSHCVQGWCSDIVDCIHLRQFYITLKFYYLVMFMNNNTIVVAVWLSGNIVGRINEVTLRRAGLVLRWVTVRGYTVLVLNQATQAHSAWPSLRG